MPSETCAASFTYFFFFSFAISAAQQTDAVYWSPPNVAVSFRPSVALVIGIFALMFFLTFLLIYGKVCHSAAAAHATDLLVADAAGHGRFILPQDRFSGIDRTVIESLPFFRFSSLRGVRDGLECAVCLSKFDDAEVLRLLPKCKHAFHVRCVDRWLEAHSSCPVCRCMVNADDDGLFKYSTSSRFLFASDRLEASGRDLELFVEREPNDARNLRGSSGFSISSSFRNTDKWRELPTLEEGASGGRILHKFKHKIIVSDVVFKSRWSDVNSSDLISLDLMTNYSGLRKRWRRRDCSRSKPARSTRTTRCLFQAFHRAAPTRELLFPQATDRCRISQTYQGLCSSKIPATAQPMEMKTRRRGNSGCRSRGGPCNGSREGRGGHRCSAAEESPQVFDSGLVIFLAMSLNLSIKDKRCSAAFSLLLIGGSHKQKLCSCQYTTLRSVHLRT